MAERQAVHRQGLEKTSLARDARTSLLGQIFAFVISLAAILVGAVLVYGGKPVEGFVSILGTLTYLALVFIWGTKAKAQQLKQAMDDLNSRLKVPPPTS